jgi:hypothetical protein
MWRRFIELFDWAARVHFAGTAVSAGAGWAVTFFGLSAIGWDPGTIWLGSLVAGACCALIFIAFRAHQFDPQQSERPQQEATRTEPEHWPLRDLFAYLAPHLPLRATKKTEGGAFIDGIDERWKPVGEIVLRQLSLGRVHATGRLHQRPRRLQPAPIPADFWRDAKFTYWFLDAGPSNVQDASNGRESYSEIEVISAEAKEIWPRGAEFFLLDATRQIWDRIKDSEISIVIVGLTDGADDILTWICNRVARPQNGKEPLVKLWGNQPPSRIPEEIYMAPLSRYDFMIEGNAIVFQERYGKLRYENLTVTAAEVDRAIRELEGQQQ